MLHGIMVNRAEVLLHVINGSGSYSYGIGDEESFSVNTRVFIFGSTCHFIKLLKKKLNLL